MSVPDWPATYGYNMFLFPYSQWIGGIFYEHSHRLLASFVGLCTVILAVWVQLSAAAPLTKRVSILAVFLVVLQGLLGGLTVLFRLPDAISIAHGVIAQTFLLVAIGIAFSLRHYNRCVVRPPTQLDRLGVVAVFAIFGQLFLGALVRHAEAGLAVLDFPTIAGQWLPTFGPEMLASINVKRQALGFSPVDLFQVIAHVMHRIWALVVVGVLLWYCVKLRMLKSDGASWLGLSIGTLLFVQFALGIITILSLRHPWLASLHVVVGAILLGATFFSYLSVRFLEDSV